MIEMRPAHALLLLLAASASARYHGREIGALSQLNHGVKGTVYAVDARTLFINDFHYDGVGPAAYFYVGTSGKPSANGGIRLRDERGNTNPLRKYRGEGVTVSLPDGLTLRDVKWFSVWCDDYAVNFGDVTIPRDLEYPKPAKVGALRGVHGVSSDPVVVVDAQTLLVPNFSYDGEAPDAKFWVGRGETPSPQGIRIPDENGKEAPLRKYDKKTIVLTLPGELTVFDIGHFAVWCEAFTVNFGHVPLPRAALSNVPPSLKMLGVSPQSRNSALVASSPQAPPRAPARAHRPKIAKLDATTYRPALALAAGPRASPDHRPAAHEHLHRRAYTHTSQHQLVQVQPSQELHYKHFDPQSQTDLYQIHQRQGQTENQQNFGNGETDPYQLHQGQQQSQNQENYRHQQDQTDLYQVYQGQKQSQAEQTQSQQNYKNQQREEDLYRQYQEQKQRLEELQRQYQQTQQNQGQDLYNQQQQSPQQYQQQSDQYLNQYQQREQQEQQSQLQYQQQEQQHQQQYTGDHAAYERQLYERQLVEQQRLAFEREAQHQRGPGDGEPFRYRLLPYSYEGSH